MQRSASYGVDAPGLVGGLIGLGLLLALWAIAGLVWRVIPVEVGVVAGCVAALFLGYAAAMLRSSLVGKKRVRDRLVAALALATDARVLDAGCGRGLALIGCAKALTTGKAVGVDLWTADVSGNSPAATRANAAAEGVADRVEVETGDLRRLPFADASFDAIISMTVIHNIHSPEGRDEALSELVRVLKPGGRIAIFDLLFTPRYADVLRRAGFEVRQLSRELLWLFPGATLIAEKPALGDA